MMPRARLTLSCAALFTTSLLSPRAEAQVQFVDVTVPMGVDYIQNQTPLIASEAFVMTGAAAAGDYDGDGWTDLIVTRADDAALLFRNKGRDLTGASRGFE
ncbi:MAG: hypothetical protein ACI841_004384, partial [Planctomycetota bacterium]